MLLVVVVIPSCLLITERCCLPLWVHLSLQKGVVRFLPILLSSRRVLSSILPVGTKMWRTACLVALNSNENNKNTNTKRLSPDISQSQEEIYFAYKALSFSAECTRMHGFLNNLTSRSTEEYCWYTTGGRGSAWSCKGDLTNRSLDVRLLDQSKELILAVKVIDYPLEN